MHASIENGSNVARQSRQARPGIALELLLRWREPLLGVVGTVAGTKIEPREMERRSLRARIGLTLPTPLTFLGDDAALVDALRAGHPGAAAAFYDRYAEHVRLTLRSILGPDEDVPDLLQEVFIRALDRIRKLREVDRLESWLTTIAVFVARAQIRIRSRRRWLGFFSPERARPTQLEQPSSDARRALREVHAILDQMPLNERTAFVLRYLHRITLLEAAAVCKTSLATFKRRLARAEGRFRDAVRARPEFTQWLDEGTKWTEKKT